MSYTSKDPLIVEVVKKRFKESIQAASFDNINRLIFHSSYRPFYSIRGSKTEKLYIKTSIEFWQDFESNIPDGMTVFLENVEDDNPEVLAEIISGINSPKICFCFDLAHAHVYSSARLYEWVQVLGDKIKHVHLSDNDGSYDSHLPLGKGDVPLLSTIRDILKYADEDVVFTLECDIPLSVEWLKNKQLLTSFL